MPREHSYKDMFACGCLVYITMRCIDFADKDFTEYMNFYGQEEFKDIVEAAKTIGMYHEFVMFI